MTGYWPTNFKSPLEIFESLKGALKLRDDNYIIQTLNQDIAVLRETDIDGNTLLHFAAIEGCSERLFGFLLKNCLPAQIEQENLNGLTVLNYLEVHNRAANKALLIKLTESNRRPENTLLTQFDSIGLPEYASTSNQRDIRETKPAPKNQP